MDVNQLIQQYGLVTVAAVYVIYQIVKTWSFRTQADTVADSTITTFAVDFNEERRELQAKVEKLQQEQSREAGKLEMLEATLIRERKETRDNERDTIEKLYEMKTQLEEFRKLRDNDQKRITELEQQQTNAQSEIDKLRTENKLLQAQKQELEVLLEREINRSNTLSGLVDKINRIEPMGSTQPIPELIGVAMDDTVIPESTSAAAVAAEEIK